MMHSLRHLCRLCSRLDVRHRKTEALLPAIEAAIRVRLQSKNLTGSSSLSSMGKVKGEWSFAWISEHVAKTTKYHLSEKVMPIIHLYYRII